MAGTQTIVRFTSERNYTATAVRLDGDPVPLLRPREIKAGVEYEAVMVHKRWRHHRLHR